MSEETFKEENIFTQHDVENEQLKEENEKWRKENEKIRNEENEKLRKEENENENENELLRENNVAKDVTIKESMQKPKDIKSPEEGKYRTDSYPNWFDKNMFKNILAITESNKFSHKNKRDHFEYIDIKELVNNIRNDTINEISAKNV